MKKITLATLKSFIRKNSDSLMVKTVSDFDPMEDGVRSTGQGFVPATKSDYTTTGIRGAYTVGGGRDWFKEYNENGMKGIYCSNSCGTFIVAVQNS